MGYYSQLDGEIIINPPLKWAEFRESGYLPQDYGNGPEVEFKVAELPRETDEGTVWTKLATAVVPAEGDERSMYDIDDHLAKIAALTKGHETTGWLQRKGQEQGDIERYRFEDGRVISEKATLRWPDGSDVTGHEL